MCKTKNNTINRKHHFKSGCQAYTAWITVDTDMKVVYRPEECPEFAVLPDSALPAIIIKNDNNPDEHYKLNYSGSGIVVDGDCNFHDVEDYEISEISFDKRNNMLSFYLCVDANTDIEDYEDEDDWYMGDFDIPCDKLLAAFILKAWCFDDTAAHNFDEKEFMENSACVKDFIIED